MAGDRSFVIVGGSLAGATAAATLRDEGFDGRVVIIGAEPLPPYERPALSKEFLRGEQPLEEQYVRSEAWYADHEVETRFGSRAVQLDMRDREVVLAGGDRLAFDALLVATGSRNRKLDVPGATLPGVFDLRTAADAQRIKDAAVEGA
ncbi:MAG: FAD-dependent oxidoreductase, partial [Actinomycetota bacterium]